MPRYAMIDPGFLVAASDPGFRQRARSLLIAKYFHPEDRAALYSLCDIKVPDEDAIAEQVRYQPIAEATNKGRDARFRIMVLSNYTFTCALTRYRLTTVSSECIVDAAHIHQFAASRNDDPRNGLALCKNAHWLFDNGLWSSERRLPGPRGPAAASMRNALTRGPRACSTTREPASTCHGTSQSGPPSPISGGIARTSSKGRSKRVDSR